MENKEIKKDVGKTRQLERLIGKIIYRDVPAKNETEYDVEYQNIPYMVDSYNERTMSLKDKSGKLITLARNL